MKKIIIHWTAGTNFPCSQDLFAYHFLIDKNGKIYNGVYKPEDNENCYDGKYAKHCGGGNTGAIGVSLCGMTGFDLKNKKTNYPLTDIQCNSAFKFISQLCKQYNIDISDKTVLTHYEFGLSHPKTSSFGKIDIAFLPPYPHLKANEIGFFIRNCIKITK